MRDNRISIGLLTGLDYEDPGMDPHREFQRFKTHPFVASLLKKGKILQYGANTAPVGGYFSIPQLYFDGGLLVGDCGNLFISQKIKGIHAAMKSGMLAAETIFQALCENNFSARQLKSYEAAVIENGVGKELYRSRNFHQLFQKGLYQAIFWGGIQYLLGGKIIKPRLFTEPDHDAMKTNEEWNSSSLSRDADNEEIAYDGELTFDKESDVYYSGTSHEEHQPPHIKIINPTICYEQCIQEYQAPCQRFCPAKVYEMLTDTETGKPKLRINFSNCLHCKTCDVKDPYKNITWTPPEGGDGPKYTIL
jgi:electron-transferring-flavoprotein dehydrogenase